MKNKLFLLSILCAINLSALSLGDTPKEVVLSGENGSLVHDAKPWNTATLKGNVSVILYMDPDKKSDNEGYMQSLIKFKKENNLDFTIVAIVNLAATWKPDFVIEKLLASKQKEFPNIVYVKDKKSFFVKEWGLEDDASNLLILNNNGEVVFYKSGKLDTIERQKSFQVIKELLKKS
ncbi:YtfJ family protein [Sulfurimonas sp.]|uniref:YtfJ family protein n=1 Tax=Sulfurimonas sp. TaxID=2022749 RepID=UPI00260AC483|nr:YtfJ family protein [Sulfurimonas sp.]